MVAIKPGSEFAGGKYRVVRLLGKGGMGAVFEAENTLTRKRVALKVLHAAADAKPEAGERLIREAQASARVRHPNVVDVYDVGRHGNTVFLVMEYLEGIPLSKALAPSGLPAHRAISLLLPAMRAVAAAHRQGVLHRDIKPDNLFLASEDDTPEPVVKVLDFGVSKLESRDESELSLTRPGSTLGTPLYMSFEQLQGQKDLDRRTDVYAFGVILYQALTGRLPFQADTLPALIVQLMTQKPVSPKVLRPELPTALDRVVMWSLEREREERIPSLEALIRELEPFASERGLRAEMTLDDDAVPTSLADTLDAALEPLSGAQRPLAPARPVTDVQASRPHAPRVLGFAFSLAVLSLVVLAVWRSHAAPPSEVPRNGARAQAVQDALATTHAPAGLPQQEREPVPAVAHGSASAPVAGPPTAAVPASVSLAPGPKSSAPPTRAITRTGRRRNAPALVRASASPAESHAQLPPAAPTAISPEPAKPATNAAAGSATSGSYRVGAPPLSSQF